MAGRRTSAARPDNRPYGVATTPDPTPQPGDFIPGNAEVWFDYGLTSQNSITAINTAVTSAPYVGYPSQTYTRSMTADNMDCSLIFKNNCVKPRMMAGGPYKGALNCMAKYEADTDPNGGPPYIADGNENTVVPESIQRAHRVVNLGFPDGSHFRVAYGRYFKVGIELLVRSEECSAAAFRLPASNWVIPLRLTSTDTPSTSNVALRMNNYSYGNQFFVTTSYGTSANKEEGMFYAPGNPSTDRRVDSGGGGLGPKDNWGIPWQLDTVYRHEIEGVIDKDSTRGWFRWWMNGQLITFATGIKNGKYNDSDTRELMLAKYHTYKLNGLDSQVIVTRAYGLRGSTGFPSP